MEIIIQLLLPMLEETQAILAEVIVAAVGEALAALNLLTGIGREIVSLTKREMIKMIPLVAMAPVVEAVGMRAAALPNQIGILVAAITAMIITAASLEVAEELTIPLLPVREEALVGQVEPKLVGT